MCRDAIHLTSSLGALRAARDSYAEASRSRAGTAVGVELRTLAVARACMAERFAQRLSDIGGAPHPIGAASVVDVAVLLARNPRDSMAEVLRGERSLIDDLAARSQDDDITDDTRALYLRTIPAMRAHTHRVETFLHTL